MCKEGPAVASFPESYLPLPHTLVPSCVAGLHHPIIPRFVQKGTLGAMVVQGFAGAILRPPEEDWDHDGDAGDDDEIEARTAFLMLFVKDEA